jgi:putative toxin-antitoxin system antitoxin component (TIGR02293 family)
MQARSARGRTLVAAHVGRHAPAARHVVARIRKGLPVGEFDALRAVLGLTVDKLARGIGISVATLSRRRSRGEPLGPDHGDRLLRYARLYRHAVDLYDGDEAAARDWLTAPARALDGETPLAFAETEAGALEVERLIGRLEHAVYT